MGFFVPWCLFPLWSSCLCSLEFWQLGMTSGPAGSRYTLVRLDTVMRKGEGIRNSACMKRMRVEVVCG